MEDVPLLGQHQNGEDPPPPLSGGWVVAAGIGVAALIVVVTGSGTGEPDTPTATSTVPDVPTVSVPPTLPAGEVVEETLRWERVVGLEDAVHLGGATEFDGAYWMAGATENGLGVWRNDGEGSDAWRLFARIDDTEAWQITDLEATDDRLAMAATGPEGAGTIFSSGDGRRWNTHGLPSNDPRRPVTSPSDITPFRNGVVIRGYARSGLPTRDLLDGLPTAVVDLVESGNGQLMFTPAGLTVTVPPGLEIAHIPPSELPEDLPRFAPPRTRVWRGEDMSDLAPVEDEIHPWRVEVMKNGLLVGPVGNRLATSRDGEDWEPSGPVIDGMTDFVPWEQGVVVATADEGLRYWTPGSSATSSLLPRGPVGQSAPVHSPLAGKDWGLAMFAQTSTRRSLPERTPISTAAEGELDLLADYRLQLVRDGEVVWTRRLPDVPVTLDAEGDLLLGPERDPAPVELEEWLEAALHLRQPSGGLSVIHTPDARSWSSSDWEELMGSRRIGSPSLLSTESFLIAVDQAAIRPFRGVSLVLGRPLQQTTMEEPGS